MLEVSANPNRTMPIHSVSCVQSMQVFSNVFPRTAILAASIETLKDSDSGFICCIIHRLNGNFNCRFIRRLRKQRQLQHHSKTSAANAEPFSDLDKGRDIDSELICSIIQRL
ncbi:hypothetical protein PoB_000108800 [Plakobranchus ocellatus]|uniref:Uncharacterized protein n=1 Tax=Plakobranchus ocellatus TaxID=259542 RepID=A0AAV3XW44_9GAST|nr:hypothetical protein PoB_000108800 [Plakobranchus ocellatus]